MQIVSCTWSRSIGKVDERVLCSILTTSFQKHGPHILSFGIGMFYETIKSSFPYFVHRFCQSHDEGNNGASKFSKFPIWYYDFLIFNNSLCCPLAHGKPVLVKMEWLMEHPPTANISTMWLHMCTWLPCGCTCALSCNVVANPQMLPPPQLGFDANI